MSGGRCRPARQVVRSLYAERCDIRGLTAPGSLVLVLVQNQKLDLVVLVELAISKGGMNTLTGSFGWLLIIVIVGAIRFIAAQSRVDHSRSYISPTNTSFNAEKQQALNRQLSELLKDSDPKLIESVFGKEKGKQFQDLKGKGRAAEVRLKAAREKLEEIRGRSDDAKSASPVKFAPITSPTRLSLPSPP